MVRWLVAVAALALLVAGCTSQESPPSEAAPSATYVVTAAPDPVDTTPRTDTLFLMDTPHLVGQAPAASEPLRIPVPSDLYAQVAVPVWSLPRPDLPTLVTTVHVFVEVTGNVANYGTATSAGCFWTVALQLGDGGESAFNNVGSACLPEGPVVAPGVHELVFEIPAVDVSSLDGLKLSLGMATFGTYAPGAGIAVLAGTTEYPSSLTIKGLQLPITTQTLLV